SIRCQSRAIQQMAKLISPSLTRLMAPIQEPFTLAPHGFSPNTNSLVKLYCTWKTLSNSVSKPYLTTNSPVGDSDMSQYGGYWVFLKYTINSCHSKLGRLKFQRSLPN